MPDLAKFPNKVYRYSFSGADARGYAYYPGLEDKLFLLESLQTISVSVHEAKGQGRALGYRGIKGIARGVRTIAGSMILTVIEDHPLRGLVSSVGEYIDIEPAAWGEWSFDRNKIGVGSALSNFDFTNRLATLLPPFNILMLYVSEGAQFSSRKIYPQQGENINASSSSGANLTDTIYDIPGAAYLIEGIDIVDVGIVTSVHDIITEVTVSFLARNYKPLSKLTLEHTQHMPASEDDLKDEKLRQKLFPNSIQTSSRVQYRESDAMRTALQKAAEDAGYEPEQVKQLLRSFGFVTSGD